jgi:hypothetical protein
LCRHALQAHSGEKADLDHPHVGASCLSRSAETYRGGGYPRFRFVSCTGLPRGRPPAPDCVLQLRCCEALHCCTACCYFQLPAPSSQTSSYSNPPPPPRLPGATALFFSFFLFSNAAWCVWTPQPRGTQPQIRRSVVGLLRGLLAPRLSGSRGSPPCAFPALSPTRFGLLVVTKPHTSGGFGSLRVSGGEGGDSRPFSGFFSVRGQIDHSPTTRIVDFSLLDEAVDLTTGFQDLATAAVHMYVLSTFREREYQIPAGA